MEKSISINSNELQIKEYNGQRVVTFKDIDAVHGRPDGTARKRFNDNKIHFIEGVDYFVRKTDEAKNEFGITAPNGLTLITESGYLMLVKSFTDDLAWTVQRELVNNYFRIKTNYGFKDGQFVKTFRGEKAVLFLDFVNFEKMIERDISQKLTESAIRYQLNRLCTYGNDYLVLRGKELGEFIAENPGYSTRASAVTILTELGFNKLWDFYSNFSNNQQTENKSEKLTVSRQYRVVEDKLLLNPPKPRAADTDECIVTLNVLRYLKAYYRNKMEKCDKCRFTSMLGYYQESMASLEKTIEAVGMLIATGY